jgi:hypothetical protein
MACPDPREPRVFRTPSGSTSASSTLKPTERYRSARSASSWSVPCTRGRAATATTTCRRRPWRRGGTSGSTRRRAAPRRGRLVLLRRPLQGRATPAAARTSAPTR